MIFKPPKYGVLLHAPLLRAFADSFPPGVVNTIYGGGRRWSDRSCRAGTSMCWLSSGRPRWHRSSSTSTRDPTGSLRLGLEAKNAAVVLRPTRSRPGGEGMPAGRPSFNGQRCTAIKFIFVHRSLADQFVARFAEGVEALRVGMPWEDGVSIHAAGRRGQAAMVQAACRRGGGGWCPAGTPRWCNHRPHAFLPAVLYPAALNTRICQIEQFGPVTRSCPTTTSRKSSTG